MIDFLSTDPRSWLAGCHRWFDHRVSPAGLFFILLLISLLPKDAKAQFQTVMPQTVDSTLATNLACTGSDQNFTTDGSISSFENLGQVFHSAYLTSSNIGAGTFVIKGSMDGVNYQPISETATIAGFISGTPNSFVVGSGRYALIRITVNCSTAGSGSFSLKYSGSGATPGALYGSQFLSQYDKTIVDGLLMGSNFTSNTFQPPFGNAAGTLYFKTVNAPPSGSSIAVICKPGVGVTNGAAQIVFNFSIVVTTTLQQFSIPSQACSSISVSFTSGGASTDAYYVDYVFSIPGGAQPTNAYSHISGTTATVVKGTPGLLHTLSVNTSAAGTVSIFDLATAACTGTPSTNTFAVITVGATDPAKSMIYDAAFLNGICVKASVAMDLTASYQ